MKIEKVAPPYSPIVITLETPQDADHMLTLMMLGRQALRADLNRDHRFEEAFAETICRAIGVI